MKTGLVLEGGAMRGMFTAGVMDVLMENDVDFDGVIGVSAGAAFGCNYKSKQIGRVIRYNTRFCADKRYCGLGSLLKTGNIYNTDFCYSTVPLEIDPFDFAAYDANPQEFYVVCTDIESGQLEWLVVGIGLNLTTSPADWPEELARTAGSLYPGGPAPVGRAALAGAIARELLALSPDFSCLDEYRALCFVPGHWVTVCTNRETYAAKALFIDGCGQLVVERENGRTVALRHGEVSIRPARTT